METDEVSALDEGEDIDIYDDICGFDLGEEIEKLRGENKKLEEHICSLNRDKDKLNVTIAALQETQNNLTKNISTLFVTAKAEIERKNRMIEELRVQVDNIQINKFNFDVKKRNGRENSPLEANKSKKFKLDDSTAKSDVFDNNKQESKSDDRQESRSNHSDRNTHVEQESRSKHCDRNPLAENDNIYQHRSNYRYDNYSDQIESGRGDPRFGQSNENTTFEFRNKHYSDRYNSYEDDGYHSRSYDRYRNEYNDRCNPRSQYFNDGYNGRANRDEMYNDRDYQYYNRNSRNNIEDPTFRDRDEYRGEQDRYNMHADNRRNDYCDSSYSWNEQKRSWERPGHSRPGTPFTCDITTSQKIQETSHDAINSETNPETERPVTPMPLPEDIEIPKPKPLKKRLKMLEEMEKKVKQNRLSQANSSRLSDQSEISIKDTEQLDSNKSNLALSRGCDSDKNSATSSKSTKSDRTSSTKSDRTSRSRENISKKEKVLNKRNTKCSNIKTNEKFDARNVDVCPKNIKQSPAQTKTKSFQEMVVTLLVHDESEHILRSVEEKTTKKTETGLTKGNSLEVNNEKRKMTSESASKDKQKSLKITAIEKDVKRTASNESRNEIKSSSKDSSEKSKSSQNVISNPDDNSSMKLDKKCENKVKETKNLEGIANLAKEVMKKPTKLLNKNPEVVIKEEKSSLQTFNKSINSEKESENSKEDIGKQSGIKGPKKDIVDSQGKTEEKGVVRMVNHNESKTKEDSVENSQRCRTRSCKEKEIPSKDATTENDQKDKKMEQTTKQNMKKTEKHKDVLTNTNKKQKQEETVSDSSTVKPKVIANERRQSKDYVANAEKKDGEKATKGSNKSTDQVNLDTAKEEVIKGEKGKEKGPSNKKNKKGDHSEKQDKSIEHKPEKVETKVVPKENIKTDVKEINKELPDNKKVQLEHEKDVKRKRRRSTFIEQDDNIKSKIKKPEEHSSNAGKECKLSKDKEIMTTKESQSSKEKKTEPSVGCKLRQFSKDKSATSKQNLDTDIPNQIDEKEKEPMNILDDKTSHIVKSDLVKQSSNIKKSEKDKQKDEHADKATTNANQDEQKNRFNEVKKKIRFLFNEELDESLDQYMDRKLNNQNIPSEITTNDTISEVKQVELKEPQNCMEIVEANPEFVEKTQGDSSNKRKAERQKHKTSSISPGNVSCTSSSTDSESDSQEESSNDILSTVKTVNKLIEIKDVEQDTVGPMETIASLSDSSTSDDTVVMCKPDNTKTIEKKFDSLINHYIENFATEIVSDKSEKAMGAETNSLSSKNINTETEIKDQTEPLEEVATKTTEPKVKILEVINIVNTSNNTADSSKECTTVDKLAITSLGYSNLSIQTNSANSAMPTKRRITPTPVKDNKPLCSFENILTKTETFTPSVQTSESPLHLTQEGEIPVLHLDENHINELPTEVNINDKNIINLLDSMNISNIDCDIPKFKSFPGETTVNPEASAVDGEESLTFENKIDKVTSTPLKNQKLESGDIANRENTSSSLSSDKITDGNVSATMSTTRRRRRRCWMIIRD